ncbi:MAG: hypothetical protein HY537_15060 [Deltaproteobacteria bacterium]|nr:hypothetical protein [Deltaproteobacteria bacterium]
MCKCSVCGKGKSEFVLNNKLVCMRCDELLIDLEIECEEEQKKIQQPSKVRPEERVKASKG